MNNVKETVNVVASKITPTNIYFKCPLCWSRYNKNGSPSIRGKPVYHVHGNETTSSDNRETHRTTHCHNKAFCGFNVKIMVTDDTVRQGF